MARPNLAAADAGAGQGRCSEHRDVVDLGRERSGSTSEGAQHELGAGGDIVSGSGPVAAGSFDETIDVERAELGPDGFGCGGDDRAHLVQRLGPGFASGKAGNTQHTHGFDVSVACLGGAVGVAGLGGAGGVDRVLRVALATPPTALPVRSVDLDHRDVTGVEETGQPGTIRAGSLDADELDRTEAGEPFEHARVPGRGRFERFDPAQGASFVEGGSDMDVEVGVDTGGDS